MKTVVVGAGAAGLMAAYASAMNGSETLVLEKNEKAGKKIYITGKGRCNVTNACDFDVFVKNILNGSRFMMSSLRAFGPEDMMTFLDEHGCHVKTERGNRVFPVSDHASDVTKALLKGLEQAGVRLCLNTEVRSIEKNGPEFQITAAENGKKKVIKTDRVIVCTGGLSYPTTGSTGDGYRFAAEHGLNVRHCVPSLVSLHTEEDTVSLAGVSLKNIGLRLYREDAGKPVYEDEGELLFTHQGISGPLVLSATALLAEELNSGTGYRAEIDLKPALDDKTLDARLLRDFENAKNADVGNVLAGLLIGGIRQEILKRAGIESSKKVHDLTRADRESIRKQVKHMNFAVRGTGGFEEAVVTKGGVDLKEIDPKTMESKKVPGLYFAGEVLDVDAYTGGFNLQLAWSTGHAAGSDTERR